MKFTISQRNLEVKVFILDLRRALGQEILLVRTWGKRRVQERALSQEFQAISALDP
jgi:hypothetical protein